MDADTEPMGAADSVPGATGASDAGVSGAGASDAGPGGPALADRPTIDADLVERARALLDVPLAERADAFDELNRDVVAALRRIEQA